MKKLSVILVFVMIMSFLAGCQAPDVREGNPKDFSKEGMKITLTDRFVEDSEEGFFALYDSASVAVFVTKESFNTDVIENFGDYTLEEYAALVDESNDSITSITTVEGFTCAEYEFHNSELNKDYKYFIVMLKGTDAFWLFQFACETANYDEYRPSFISWAKTISLD